jgi:hypothetical protein
MSLLAGEPLGARPVSIDQEQAIAVALNRLHHAIPPSVLASVEPAPGRPQLLPDRVRDMARDCDPDTLDPQPRQAYAAVLAWLDTGAGERAASVAGHPVFAQGDPNLANHLYDGGVVRLVDFEASGRGDQATELADFVEHITVWAHAAIDAESFLDRFDLTAVERRRITQLRRLFASFWLMRLLPGGNAHQRNPPGTFERQASRLLDLLGPNPIDVPGRIVGKRLHVRGRESSPSRTCAPRRRIPTAAIELGQPGGYGGDPTRG